MSLIGDSWIVPGANLCVKTNNYLVPVAYGCSNYPYIVPSAILCPC